MRRKVQVSQWGPLKLLLLTARLADSQAVHYRDKKGKLATKMAKYGESVDKIYPLLDPRNMSD